MKHITHVYSFPNGMTMVFDQHGHQMNEYQGRTDEVMPKIRAAGFTGAVRQRTWEQFVAEQDAAQRITEQMLRH